jgi:hypothetical protein
MFFAVIGEQELAPGEEWAFTFDDVLDVEPGTYEVEASVTVGPPAASRCSTACQCTALLTWP